MISLSLTLTFWPLLSASPRATSLRGRISWMSWIRPRLRLRPQLLRTQPSSTCMTKKTISHPVQRTAAVAQLWTNLTASLDCQHPRGPSTLAWVSIPRRSQGRYYRPKMGRAASTGACPKSACPSRNRYLMTRIELMLYFFTATKTMEARSMRKISHRRIS